MRISDWSSDVCSSDLGTDAFFRHDDDGLANALVRQLIERDEHEGAALARRRGRLDKKILLAALLIGAFLHRSHAEGVGFIGVTVAGIRNRDGRNCFLFYCHAAAPALDRKSTRLNSSH